MDEPRIESRMIRDGAWSDLDACLDIWVAACAARDGQAVEGVAERARPKFANGVVWLVADSDAGLGGFVLATHPGSGRPDDPKGAAVVGLLAVAPYEQARGLGRHLLRSATTRLAALGYERAVLHALVDNTTAVRLYESEGWEAIGDPYEHSLLKRPARTYARALLG
ncbi:MAG TPA: GNAT family N-acetyltransferase [Leifsonia sp.]|jgi:ribosomal protein S18 acetylase RimI-like enzyme|nr:GNAT family N-acetyltransferase [Leifsonia sp.]